MPMRPEDIPRRQERLILADATQKFERLLITRIFATHDIAAFAELAYIARALWSATLQGQALTAQQIAHAIGMPRTTVLLRSGSGAGPPRQNNPLANKKGSAPFRTAERHFSKLWLWRGLFRSSICAKRTNQ
jgi:hypothetical protein